MVSFANIPDLIGYLVLNEHGAVLESEGDLKNDERSANLITSIINLTDNVDPQIFTKSECQRISIVFEQHSYTICLSNKKIYVVKRRGSNNNNNNQQQKQRSSSPAIIGFQPETDNSNSEPASPQTTTTAEWTESA